MKEEAKVTIMGRKPEELFTLFDKSYAIYLETVGKITELPFDIGLSTCCILIEAVCKKNGKDIFEVADVIGGLIRDVNNQIGETLL